MANDQYAQGSAEPDQDEALFADSLRVVVFQQNTPLVVEDGLRLIKGDTMLPLVLGILGIVPLELQHGCTVATT